MRSDVISNSTHCLIALLSYRDGHRNLDFGFCFASRGDVSSDLGAVGVLAASAFLFEPDFVVVDSVDFETACLGTPIESADRNDIC